MSKSRIDEVLSTVERIKPLLAGREREVTGAILANLTAIWLAGHWIPGEPALTKEMREQVLSAHNESMEDMVTAYAAEIGTAH